MERFPEDFMLQLTKDEYRSLRSLYVILDPRSPTPANKELELTGLPSATAQTTQFHNPNIADIYLISHADKLLRC